MADLATLGLRFESQEAVTAEKRLDDVAQAAGRAESATEGLASSSKATNGAIAQMAAQAEKAAKVQRAYTLVHSEATKQSKALTQATLNMTRQFSDVGVSLASGINPLMVLIQQGPQIADGFQMAAAQGLGFKAVIKGMVAEIGPLLVTFAPWIAGLGAVSAGVWYLVDAHNKQKKAVKDLTAELATQREELGKISPFLFQTGANADLAADGQRNFDAWLRKTNVSLEEQNRLLRENALNELNTKALAAADRLRQAQEQFDKVNKRGPVMMASPGGFGVVAPVQATDPKNNPFFKQAESNLKEAKEAAKAIGEYQAKMGQAPDVAFVTQTAQAARAATTAIRQLQETVELSNDTVSASTVVWPEATAAAEAYKTQQDAVSTAQRDTIKTMQEIVGAAPHFSTTLESMAIEAERLARQAYDVRVGIEDIAYAIKNNDFTGAFSGLLSVLAQVEKAFAQGATAADKFAAVSGVAQGVGSVMGGRTGATISGIGSGAAAGFQLGGPAGAAIGAALGGAMAFIGASNARAQAKIESLMKAQQDFQAAQLISSDSIAKSLDEASRYQNRDLQYSNSMLAALRSINTSIGSAAASLGRQISGGGPLSSAGLDLGSTSKSGGLGGALVGGVLLGAVGALVGALMKTKTTTEILDQGLQFTATSLAQVNAGGLMGQTYADLLSTTKKSVFGINVSTKVKTSTQMGALDPAVADQISGVVSALGSAVQIAASQFGDAAGAAAKSALESATIDLGKLSLKGLTAEEIEKALNATFTKVGDDLAKTAVPALEQLQQVGEGALQTLVRVATEYQTVDVTLSSIGKTFGAVGLSSLAARDNLVNLAGGLDALVEQTSFYAENFLTEAERIAPVQSAVTAELARLGLAGVTTKDAFKAIVQGLDLSTDAGSTLYAALLAVAPAFAKVADYANGAAEAVSNAAELAKQQRSLDIALMEAQGNAAGALAAKRTDELAAMDASLRATQEAINFANDAAAGVATARDVLTQAYQRESSALEATRDKFADLAKTLGEFRASLDLTDAATAGQRYGTSRSAFQDTAGRAQLGDAAALGSLPAISQQFLDASKEYQGSSLDYQRDLAAVKRAVEAAQGTASRTATNADKQLMALNASVSGLIQINQSVVSVADAIADLKAALGLADAAGVTSVGGSGAGLGGSSLFGAEFQERFNAFLAADAMKTDAQRAAEQAAALAEGQAFLDKAWGGTYPTGTLPGFATGGSGMVGGSGGPDSKLVSMRLTPGELVNVDRASSADSQNELMNALITEVRELRIEVAKGTVAGRKTADLLTNVTRDGNALVTEAA